MEKPGSGTLVREPMTSTGAAFDTVFLQQVAMNLEDRAGLYREMRRILSPGGRFATCDLVLRSGDVLYPRTWGTRCLDQLLKARKTRGRGLKKLDSKRFSGVMTPTLPLNGSRPWPVRRQANRTSV